MLSGAGVGFPATCCFCGLFSIPDILSWPDRLTTWRQRHGFSLFAEGRICPILWICEGSVSGARIHGTGERPWRS